jgi:hypothetical protein
VRLVSRQWLRSLTVVFSSAIVRQRVNCNLGNRLSGYANNSKSVRKSQLTLNKISWLIIHWVRYTTCRL